MSVPRAGTCGFAGREVELAELERALADAAAGRGHVVLIHGEAGIGKTSFVEHFCARAEDRAARVVWGRCWNPASAPSYWPWAQVIRDLAAQPEVLAALDAPARDRVLGMLDGGGSAEADERLARFMLFDAVAQLLRAAGATGPVVVMLDDLHDADVSSLRLLDFAARAVRASGCLVIGTYREAEARLRGDVHALLDGMPDATRIGLSGLAPRALASLLERHDERLVLRLHEHTGGNPFFAVELLRLLRREERLGQLAERGAPPVPETVRATLARRLEGLDPLTKEALERLAVAGTEFDEILVHELLGADAARLVIDEAEREHLLRRTASGHGARFEHALIQAAVYEGLPAPLRARRHREVAEALERLHAQDIDPHLAALAEHYARSDGADAPRRALDYARASGARARRMLAYDDAVRHYGHARELAAAAGAGPDESARVLLNLGHAQILAGKVAAGRDTLLEAERVAERVEEPSLRSQIALGYSRPAVEGGIVNETVVRLLEAALQDADAALRPRLRARLAGELLFSSEGERRQALAREALDEARRLGDPHTLMTTLRWVQTALSGPPNTEECLAMLGEVDRLARELGNVDLRVQGLAIRTSYLLEMGRPAELQADVAALKRIATEIPVPTYRWYAGVQEVRELLMRGAFDAAEQLAQRQLEDAAEVPNAIAGWLNQMLVLKWERDCLHELAQIMEGLPGERPGLFETVRAWRPLARAEQGERAEALEELRSIAEELPDRPGAVACMWMLDMDLIAEAAALLGDPDCARAVHAALVPFAERHHHAPVMTCVAYLGSTHRHLGNLAHALGDFEQARLRHEAALAAHLRMGSATYATRSQYDLGRALMALGRSDDGGRRIAQARAAAERLGMTRLLRQISEEAPAAPRGRAPRTAAVATAALEGEYWAFSTGSRISRIRDTKGVRYLVTLLERPDEGLHALDLLQAVTGTRSHNGAPPPGLAQESGQGAEVLDTAARSAYRARLAELEETVEEAERFNDPERAAQAREEMEFVAAELGRALGLGGRRRTLGPSPAEQTRVNVTKALRGTIRRLEASDPDLGRHLRACVRTGMVCSYSGDLEPVLRWEVRSR